MEENRRNNNLVYKLDVIEGVRIDVLCKSLKAIEDEYQRFTNNQKTLVVKEVRSGSGIFEFIEIIIATSFLLMENTNTVLQFVEYLSDVKDVILNKKNKLPNNTKMTSNTVNNMNSMFSPVVNGNNNQVIMFVGNKEILKVGQSDYKEIKRQSSQAIKELELTTDFLSEGCIYKKVLFQWVQTRFDNKKSGNQGVINKIQDKAVKVIFADDNSATKAEMTTSIQGVDWQKIKYIVDVEVMFDNDKIIAYKILKNYPDDSIIEMDTQLELF